MVATIVSFMAVVNGKFSFFAGNPYCIKSFKKTINIVYNNQVKLSSLQSTCLWQLLMMASFNFFFVAGNPYFSQVVSGGVNFIVEKRKNVYTMIKSN